MFFYAISKMCILSLAIYLRHSSKENETRKLPLKLGLVLSRLNSIFTRNEIPCMAMISTFYPIPKVLCPDLLPSYSIYWCVQLQVSENYFKNSKLTHIYSNSKVLQRIYILSHWCTLMPAHTCIHSYRRMCVWYFERGNTSFQGNEVLLFLNDSDVWDVWRCYTKLLEATQVKWFLMWINSQSFFQLFCFRGETVLPPSTKTHLTLWCMC